MRAVEGFKEEYEILDWARLRLFKACRALPAVFGRTEFVVAKDGEYSTDGKVFSFPADRLKKDFLEDGELLCMKILHMFAHCMLGHPFTSRRRRERKELERLDVLMDLEAWELAARIFGREPDFLKSARRAVAEGETAELLFVDDHSIWTRTDTELAKIWRGEGEKLLRAGGGKDRRRPGRERKTQEYTYVLTDKKRGEYRALLKNFAVFREDARPDLDSFQYSWYNYGMETYGNLPLIEPLEYTEDKRISELVIAIDTSGSCVRDLVQVFLEETRGIMEEENLFFRRFCLHIIQCDDRVQSDRLIRSVDDMDAYIEGLTVKGGGGTDFRPVFERIEELRESGELAHLKGLIYFTDGCGRYPKVEPDYETVFVMPGDRYDDIDRPAWIRRILFDIG